MNYQEAIEWLYSFKRHGSKLGLERISYLTKRLGNPQDHIKIIHVAGTNGKGSVCKFVGSILKEAGYKVGIYISPHLQRFSERIVINEKEISKEDIALIVEKIKPFVDEMIKQNNTPTFFEIVTAIAFQYFSDCKVDYAVIEVGLGGRFDATNVVSPIASVITNISIEHSAQLGNTVRSIAFEKAGIIKNEVPIITAARRDALKEIKKIAAKKKAPIVIITNKTWKRLYSSMHHQEFLVHGIIKDYLVNSLILGKFQGENIAVSIATIEQLQMKGIYISDENIAKGISTAFNPGRMELLHKTPLILLDGAHNPEGMAQLSCSIDHDFSYASLVVILGILADKNINSMISSIAPLANKIIVTQPSIPRACPAKELKKIIEKSCYTCTKSIVLKKNIAQAIRYALQNTKTNDMICVTGSLFTVGEARNILEKNVNK